MSGGGYAAGGWAASSPSDDVDKAEIPVFGLNSPEEELARRNSSLLPDLRSIIGGLGRLWVGLTLNFFIAGLALYLLAGLLGLTARYFIDENLAAAEPIIEITQQPVAEPSTVALDPSVVGAKGVERPVHLPENQIPSLRFAASEDVKAQACTNPDTCAAWVITGVALSPLEFEASKLNPRWSDWLPERQLSEAFDKDATYGVELDPQRPGVVVREGGKLRITAQPTVVLNEATLAFLDRVAASTLREVPEATDDIDVPKVAIEQQLRLEVVSADSSGPPQSDQFRVVEEIQIVQRSGTTGRNGRGSPASWPSWQKWVLGVTAAGAALAGIVRVVARPVGRLRTALLTRTAWLFGSAFAVSTGMVVVVPWLARSLPATTANVVGAVPLISTGETLSGEATLATTVGGGVLLYLATLGRLLRGPVTRAARKWPWRVGRIAVGVLLVILPLLAFSEFLEISAANGLWGGLWDLSGGFMPVPEVVRLLVAAVVLIFLRVVIDSHSWSLFPLYKRWLSRAFVSDPSEGAYRPKNQDQPRAPTPAKAKKFDYELVWKDPYTQLGKGGPELILCCAVNLHGRGEAASGRKAGSFVFSREHVGGPDVGWHRTSDYLKCLKGTSRRKDVTILASMAISGAAFSPGMGKMTLGSLGGLMALMNARLGVWLPHPGLTKKLNNELIKWRGRPGWTWWIREIFLLFRAKSTYLYVSDGGHWENLGVVELLRRGCNQIYLVSAAGDGRDGFATIGEAIALARSELGIEIDIPELDKLRAKTGDPKSEEETLVLADGTVRRYAAHTHVIGTIRDHHTGNRGQLIAIEANLTKGMPWDVIAYAESNKNFPDDSTLDQFFDHRQFESYRRLGQYQMAAALKQKPLPNDGRPRPSISP
ncbi:MAG: hypothetical protein AAF962_19015 [Actinomycetota bacterium]